MKSNLHLYGKDIEFIVEKLSICNIPRLREYDCGNDAINDHIKRITEDSLTERGFLFIDKTNNNVIAFVTFRATAVVFDSNDKRGIRLRPAIEIATFAVDTRYQHKRMSANEVDGSLSSYILSYIIDMINNINHEYCATEYIVLYSLPDKVGFYKKNLFQNFGKFMVKSNDYYTQNCVPMYFDLDAYNRALKEHKQ